LAIPFTPIAVAALRYGAVAAIAYAAAQRARPGRIHPSAEAAMEALPEGARVGHAPGQLNATGRWRRAVRLGASGPGMEVDVSALARLRLRRIA
jgi:hypothetical protein